MNTLKVSLIFLFLLTLSGCADRNPLARSDWPNHELPTIAHMLSELNEFQLSDWNGCNTDFERGQILGNDGYQQYWVCWGTTSSEHRYAITLLAAPGNEKGAQLRLEFLRGNEFGQNALISTFLRMAGVSREDERMRMRSDISRYLITPPPVRAMIQASLTPNGLPLDMGYNMPRSGYTTLQIQIPARRQEVEEQEQEQEQSDGLGELEDPPQNQ